MSTLFFDCTSGISGDMTVAALLDLGADYSALRTGLGSLGVGGYRLKISRVIRSGISACDFDVQLDPDYYTHHPAQHRTLGDIMALLSHGELTAGAKKLAQRIFSINAQAEAAAHQVPLEAVTFHEEGAVDSIVDIVATAILVDSLQPTAIYATPLHDGCGTITCRSGVLPVPVPATAQTVRRFAIPTVTVDTAGEMVTPTGAAIAAALFQHFSPPPRMVKSRIGCGAGKRHYPGVEGVLRICKMSPA